MSNTLEDRVTTLQKIVLRLPEELDVLVDAKLEERISELESRIDARLAEMDSKLAELRQRLAPTP